jgi:hypothetical protein
MQEPRTKNQEPSIAGRAVLFIFNRSKAAGFCPALLPAACFLIFEATKGSGQ